MLNPITKLKQSHEEYLKFKDSIFDVKDQTARAFLADTEFWSAFKAKLYQSENLSAREQIIFKTIEAQSYGQGTIYGWLEGTFSGILGSMSAMTGCKFIKNVFLTTKTPHLRTKKMYALILTQLAASSLLAKTIYEIHDIFGRFNTKNYSEFHKLMQQKDNPLRDFGPKLPKSW